MNSTLQVIDLTRIAKLLANVSTGLFTSNTASAVQQNFLVLEFAGMPLNPRGEFAEACSKWINGSFEMTQCNFVSISYLQIC